MILLDLKKSYIFCLLYVFSCTTSSDKLSESNKIKDSIQEKPEWLSPPSFPQRTTAWSTQKLLLTKRKSSQEEVKICFKQLDSLSEKNKTLNSMIEARNILLKKIKDNPEKYHWCFFSLLRDLDSFLSKENPTFLEKTEDFSRKMTQLWIISRALDKFYEVEDYFLFLRSRYLEHSQKIFGRRLKVLLPAGDSQILIEEHNKEKEQVLDETEKSEKTIKP